MRISIGRLLTASEGKQLKEGKKTGWANKNNAVGALLVSSVVRDDVMGIIERFDWMISIFVLKIMETTEKH